MSLTFAFEFHFGGCIVINLSLWVKFLQPPSNSRDAPFKKLCSCATVVVKVSLHHVCRYRCQLTYFISIAYAAALCSPNNSQSRIHLVITQEALLTRRTAAVTDVPFVAP